MGVGGIVSGAIGEELASKEQSHRGTAEFPEVISIESKHKERG